jgi:hypothetical protein
VLARPGTTSDVQRDAQRTWAAFSNSANSKQAESLFRFNWFHAHERIAAGTSFCPARCLDSENLHQEIHMPIFLLVGIPVILLGGGYMIITHMH